MEVLTKEEFIERKHYNTNRLQNSIFIYPTDTIYGIGCNAEDDDLVERLRILKMRFDMPLSVIAPSEEWIISNCEINDEVEEWLSKLPGPYTLILKLKNKNAVAHEVNLGSETIGVRIPDNWFSKFVKDAGVPIVTTSANISGQNFMTSIEELDLNLKKGVDFFIDVGEIKGVPSTLVMLHGSELEIKKR